nr:hypothetical protein [Microbacterium hydrocarbonoxydans]
MTDQSAAPSLQEWPARWGERRPRRNARMLWVGIVLFVLAAGMVGFSGGAAGPLLSGAALALFGLTALAVGVRRPFAQGCARVVEATALTREQGWTPDVRVHFLSERRADLAILLLCIVWALVLGSATVVAIVIGATGRPEAFLGVAVLAASAALFAYAAVRAAIARRRSSSLRRGPAGVGMGPDGVLLIRASETLYVPWHAIRRVDADVTEPRRGMPELPLIRLRVDPGRVIATDAQRVSATITVAPAMVKAHPQVVWSALHGLHRSPSARAVLGTAAGQRLFDEWCAAAAAL